MTRSITITKPDDWHVHFRDKEALANTIKASAQTFARALVMPNLAKPLIDVDKIKHYQAQVLTHAPPTFTPYFSLYLTDNLALSELEKAKKNSAVLGAKLYPAGATTNSNAGINSITSLYPLFDLMQDLNLVLQIHGETTTGDIFDREARFIEQNLMPLVKTFPKLRIVLEHISSKAACDFVVESSQFVAATITVHHLLYNRNDLLVGGIKPHFYCLPILKKASDQAALQAVALSGNPKFFLGTDSAPHAINQKESACGCAGIYSAPYAMPLYTEFFDSHNKLSVLEPFASYFGADFYQLPRNKSSLTLIQQSQKVPASLSLGKQNVRPIAADQTIQWTQKS